MTWSDERQTRPEAGWYRDPGGSGGLRWWDGTTWTGYVTGPPPTPAAPAASAYGTAYATAPDAGPAGSPTTPPAPRTPRRVWVLLAVIGLLLAVGVISAIAVPAVDIARDAVRDEEAKTLLRNTREVAIGLAVADGTYTALTPERLARNDPFHRYTDGPSTDARQLSVRAREEGFTLAVRSASGRCWIVDTRGTLLASEHPARTGRLPADRPCRAADVAAMTEEPFGD